MIDEEVEKVLQFVKTYAYDVDEWRHLKRQLLQNLPPEKRKLFSTRDPMTKVQNFNEFENKVLNRWVEITGSTLILNRS
jgi:hypothetical protein